MAATRTLGFADFTEFATDAMAGRRPYPYQQRLAEEGLPDLLRAPAGAGKTAAAVLAWLWRRMRFPNSVHDRLVYVLPLGSMAEQIGRQITTWLERLGLAATVPVVMLTGGESSDSDSWRLYPRQPAILVGTQDMVVSRLLMRGYGEYRASWPITFGLLHCSSQFVFDDAALLGPALFTSLQLHGLREKLGAAARCATMWMSTTTTAAELASPEYEGPARVVELGPADQSDERLARRLAATRTVRQATLPAAPELYPAALARALAGWHVPGSATIAVLNTTERAVAVYDALERAAHAADLLLVHALFRPPDRSLTAALLDSPAPTAGRIVVATQVLESGLDTSCRTMFTELAPWSSIVQRAGRCNRTGEERGAALWWAPPPGGSAEPYQEGLTDAEGTLSALEGTAVTSSVLQEQQAPQVPEVPRVPEVPQVPEVQQVPEPRRVPRARADHPMLRREDLLELFDTAPADLGGARIDVAPWVGDSEGLTALVAWRFWPDREPATAEPAPAGDELCPAPLPELHQSRTPYWIWDQVDGRWRRCEQDDISPGAVLLADAAVGGYVPDRGWSPGSHLAVPVIAPAAGHGMSLDAIDRDPASFTGAWVDLRTHLADTEHELRALSGAWSAGIDPQEPSARPGPDAPGFGPDVPGAGPGPGVPAAGLAAGQLEAAALAARFHDLGKASGYFQDFLREGVPGGAPRGGPWAKSPGRGGRHTTRPYMRHELVTALALLHPQCCLLDGVAEADLVIYLAAAHHGNVRLRVGPLPAESCEDPPQIMGVRDGDELPPVTLGNDAEIPALSLDTRVLDGHVSWTARMLALCDRSDLGPFRLALLEALVRIADWRASRAPSARTPPAGGTPTW